MAAGRLLVREAGGAMVSLEGDPWPGQGNVLAGHLPLLEEVLALLGSRG